MTRTREETTLIYVMCFALALSALVLIMSAKYDALVSDAQAACATTGAAAKLDLSSFVPLCKQVTQ